MNDAVIWDNKFYEDFQAEGGVVSISVLKSAEDIHECHSQAVAAAIDAPDMAKVLRISPVEIDEPTFHGRLFDCEKQSLRHVGTGLTTVPELWSLGHFAYAFCQPPYPLNMSPQKVQQAYLEITSKVAPRNRCRILSWQTNAILGAAEWLEEGTDWWGVYVFSVYNKDTRHIFGIAAAQTD